MRTLICVENFPLKKRCVYLIVLTAVPVLVFQLFSFRYIIANTTVFKKLASKDSHVSVSAVVAASHGIRVSNNIGSKRENLSTCVLNITKLNTHVSPTDRQRLIEENRDAIFGNVLKGGSFKPPGCKATGNIAIIVPYRNRKENLKLFIPHMHSFLQTQLIDYTIFVVEMVDGDAFNRGILMNIGFYYATKLQNFTCFVFHDIDLLPTNERNLYDCKSDQIRHMSTGNSKNKYRVPYPTYFGGVVSFTEKKYREVNGFSNLYFGWGNEDDDLNKRLQVSKNKFKRIDVKLGRYEAMNHTGPYFDQKQVITRHQLFTACGRRMLSEGLNSIIYKERNFELRELYTWMLIEVNKTELENTSRRMYSLRNMYQKVEILTNNSVRDAVVGQDLHFLERVEGLFSHDACHIFLSFNSSYS